ncbi:MAG: phosphoribosylglycinamide formyltransferase [Planctomycetota bacterium]
MSGRRVVVLLSGTGRSLANMIARRDSGHFDVEFAGVISSRAGVRGLVVADKAGIPVATVPRKGFADTESFSAALAEAIDAHRPDLVVMAGFLSHFRLPPALLGRVLNIHPSLLPLFGGKGYYGHHVHEAVLAAGVRVSGCTVHFVDDQYDHGPAILQLPCPVLPDDDADRLAARVFARECEALPRAVSWVLEGRARYRDGRTEYASDLDAADFR